MTHDQDELGSRNRSGKFHAAQNVCVFEITGHPGDKDVADTAIKNIFYRDSGVEAGELICVSPIESAVDGMSVKPSIEEAVS